jgi:uncharacterized protein
MQRFLTSIAKHPIPVFALVALISVLAFMQMKENTRMETDLDEYMPKDHPAFIYSDEAEEWFDIKDGIIIAVENVEGIYNPGTLGKVKDLTKKLQAMDAIERGDVTSLSNADNITGSEDGLDVRAFFRKVPQEVDKLEDLEARVNANAMIQDRLVSSDGKVTLIVARINDGAFSQEFYKEIVDLSSGYEGPEKIHVAGRPIVEGTMALLGPKDMKKMVPIVLLLIVIVLMFVLRSLKGTLLTLMVVALSTLWTFGLMAAFGIPIYAVTTMIPVMLIAIGVADGIHIYNHLKLARVQHPEFSKQEAVVDLIHNMWKPVTMTSVTTGIGFISLLTSQVYPIKYFGLFTAFGVMVAMILSLVLIPTGTLAFGMPAALRARGKSSFAGASSKFAEAVLKHRRAIFISTLILIALLGSGITKVWINSSFLEKFEKDSDIVLTDAFINEHFGGTSTLNVILESEIDDAFKDPALLALVDEMQVRSEELAEVGNSFGLTDYLKQINKVMNADDPAYDAIPESQDLVAQYLLLYEMSGDPETLWETVDYGFKRSNVMLQLKGDDSKTINKAIDIVESYRSQFKNLGVDVNYAGSGYKSLIFTDLILKGQISSLILSLVIVIVLLSLMFKRLIAGFIGAIPIVITAIVNFGVMGLLGIPLSTTTALISSIAIGVGIDYAVHFIDRYRINAALTGDLHATVKETMHHSGSAILFNAMVVMAGFLVLLFSAFPPNRALGALVSFNMFTSLVGTVTIMLVVMVQTRLYFKKSNADRLSSAGTISTPQKEAAND